MGRRRRWHWPSGVIAAFAAPFQVDELEIQGATSIGIVLAPRDGGTSNELLKHVDVALYRAKRLGIGTIQFFAPSDDAAARERRALQRDLELAVERNEFRLVYQPFLDLRDNRIAGFEALAALATSGARPGVSQRIHSDRGGDGAYSCNRRVGDPAGFAPRCRAGPTISGSP